MRSNRWVQLAAGIIGMIAVSNLQYGWTLFVNPLHDRFGWNRTAIQVAFTLFVVTETWLVPLKAYLGDRFGPRPIILLGGVLVGLAWIINSRAETLTQIYLGNTLGGIGAGAVYGICIGSALKWFPDRRGLAAGLTAAAFGAGSALTVWPIQETIRVYGYDKAFLWFGIGQAVVVLLTALILRSPTEADRLPPPSARLEPTSRSRTPFDMLSTPVFWLMYLMFTMVAMGGLMAIAQLAPMSKDLGVENEPVTLLFLTLPALTFALSIDRVLNGLTRPFFGWVSDHIGRELTMFLAFTLEGTAILLLLTFAHVPILFVLLSGLTFFAWGELFSLFPALIGDTYGPKYAATNYSLLYTAKGTASLLVPLGSYLATTYGSWKPIFYLAVGFDWIAALLALFVLWPLRRRMR